MNIHIHLLSNPLIFCRVAYVQWWPTVTSDIEIELFAFYCNTLLRYIKLSIKRHKKMILKS